MKKILIIQTAFLGDVVLATPVIEQVSRTWPGARIDFLLRKGNESLLQGHPLLHQVLIRDKSIGKWRSIRQILREVRATRYDIVVNLHRFLSSGLIAAFSRGQEVVGFKKNPLSVFYNRRLPHVVSATPPGVHEVERNLSLLAHHCGEEAAPMRLYPSAEDQEKVRIEEPYVCIAPTSVWFSKQWPGEKWVALIDTLDPKFSIQLLGAPGDRSACEVIKAQSQHPRIEVRAGELSLLQSAALMAGARMNYVNDSAPLHLASAMQAPVTAVFLSTVPRFGFGPYGPQGQTVETVAALPCRPCGLHGFDHCPKGHFKCAEIELDAFPRP